MFKPFKLREESRLQQLQKGKSFLEVLILLDYPQSTLETIVERAKVVVGGDIKSTPNELGARYFVDRLIDIRDERRSVKTEKRRSSSGSIGEDLDFLSTDCWAVGFFKALCIAATTILVPNKRIAIVATVRNEGPFILEWIAHHKAIGVDDFFIYTNNNTDESLALLEELHSVGVLNLIRNEVSAKANPQVKAYEHALILNRDCAAFRWLMFLDADELFIPTVGGDFKVDDLFDDLSQAFVDRPLPSSISFNWLWMGSGGQIFWDRDKRLAERFEVGGCQSSFVKSIVNPRDTVSMRGVHKPVLVQGRAFGVNGAFDAIRMEGHDAEFNFARGEIRHYWNKSFEEFLVKQARGVDRAIWERDTELFFRWDIGLGLGAVRPFPEALAHRTSFIIQSLRSMPGIRNLELQTIAAYGRLAAAVCPPERIVERYTVSKNRSAIKSLLKIRDDPTVELMSTRLMRDIEVRSKRTTIA